MVTGMEKAHPGSMDAGYREMRRQRITGLLLVLILIVLGSLRISKSAGNITVQVNEDALGAAGSEITVFVPLSDVESADLIDLTGFDAGRAVDPVSETSNLYEGTYRSDRFGTCTAIIGRKSTKAILVKYREGTLVLTGLSDRDTANIYEELRGKL